MSLNLSIKLLFIGILLSAIVSSCNIYKQIPENQSVLVSNNIEVLGQEKDLINDFFYKGDLYKILNQKPNKKILGIPVSQHIWAYYNQKKVTKFTQFMKTKVGRSPVIFDSTKLELSRMALENYYFNIGHFENSVSVNYKTKNKKTKVIYQITPHTPYKIKTIYYDTLTPVQKDIFKNYQSPYIQKGDIFNINNFISEIDRLTFIANDKGYFNFSKDYIRYKYDSFHNTHELDVYIKIQEESDTTQFKKYKLDDIFVFIQNGTEPINFQKDKIQKINNIYFVQSGTKNYNESFLSKFIYKTHDSIYSKGDINRTVQRLSELLNFKLINSSVKLSNDTAKSLNVLYSLAPYPKRKLSFGQYFYNSTLGFIGAQPTLNYQNRNLTHKADKLNISLSGAIEFNAYLNQNKNYSGLISRTDLTLKTGYTIEKFLIPFLFHDKKEYIYSRTNIDALYTYSKRLGYYDIHNIGTNFSFDWSKKKNTTFNYTPISINAILFPESSVSDEFKKTLEQNPFLKSTFNNSFIIGSSYTINHFIPMGKKKMNSTTLRWNIETSGNSVYLLDKVFNFSKDETGVNINDINISQYLKSQIEFINSIQINRPTSLHSRFKIGMAFPYGNSKNLPYIKQYFIGGPYSIRAFQPRTIGPGTYNPGIYGADTLEFPRDQTGNIVLELNAEYRFHIISFLKGALFVDAGNIWNSSPNFSQSELGVFKFDQFFKQLYIGSGFGIRGDFNYFIMRFDVGVPLRVPYLDRGDWVITNAKPFNGDWLQNNLIINFAVGYPF